MGGSPATAKRREAAERIIGPHPPRLHEWCPWAKRCRQRRHERVDRRPHDEVLAPGQTFSAVERRGVAPPAAFHVTVEPFQMTLASAIATELARASKAKTENLASGSDRGAADVPLWPVLTNWTRRLLGSKGFAVRGEDLPLPTAISLELPMPCSTR